MNTIFLVLFALFLPFAASADFTLEIKVNGLKKQKGFLMAEVKDSSGKAVYQIKHSVQESGSTIVVSGLQKGKYAVAVFHDADANGKLNTNLVGMPTELYGFSNDARGVFGPPSLSEQLFAVDGNKTIVITVK